MSASTAGLVTAAFFALGAAWLTGKALGVRGAGTGTTVPFAAARQQPTAARERLDLRQPLRALTATHAAMLAQRGIAVDLFLPDGPLTVVAVPGDLQQLVAHIADAAATTLPPGATLQVLARAEGHHAVINWREASTGTETGSGTDTPRLSQAFETKAGRPVTPRIHACQAIATRHRARIYTAPSPLGDGCLTLRFALHRAPAVRAPQGPKGLL